MQEFFAVTRCFYSRRRYTPLMLMCFCTMPELTNLTNPQINVGVKILGSEDSTVPGAL